MAVEGLDRLRRKARRLQVELSASLYPAVLEAANVIIAKQKDFVPVDTGALRESIHPEQAIKGGNQARVVIIAGGASAPYAPIIEFGRPRQPKQPFFFPGYRVERNRAKRIISNAVREAVRRAAR